MLIDFLLLDTRLLGADFKEGRWTIERGQSHIVKEEQFLPLLPEGFAVNISKLYGEPGAKWVRTLPDLLDRCQERFDVVLQSPVSNLSWNLVLNGTTGAGKLVVLKLGVEGEQLAREARVLTSYSKCGAATVIDFDKHLGVLLLERVHPGTPLSVLEDDQLATEVFCKVFRRFHRSSPTGDFPTITEHFRALERYRSRDSMHALPEPWVVRAKEYVAFLSTSTRDKVLLHGDLHHDNILSDAKDEWSVIDPKGIIGDLHFEVIQYLLNYTERGGDPQTVLQRRIAIMSDQLDLNPRRIAMWGLAKGVLDACWALEDGRNDWHEGIQVSERFASYLDH